MLHSNELDPFVQGPACEQSALYAALEFPSQEGTVLAFTEQAVRINGPPCFRVNQNDVGPMAGCDAAGFLSAKDLCWVLGDTGECIEQR